MQKIQHRDLGPDIIRCLAIACVVCGHFFSVNTPFNESPVIGFSMVVQGELKNIFCNLGVPLFLVLTGYWGCKKEFSIQYYKGIKRVIVPYVITLVDTNDNLYLTQSQFLLWFIPITSIVLISSYILARITRYISDFTAKMFHAKLR